MDSSILEKRRLTSSFSFLKMSCSFKTFWKMNSMTWCFKLGEMFSMNSFSSFWFSYCCWVNCRKPTILDWMSAGILIFCMAVFT